MNPVNVGLAIDMVFKLIERAMAVSAQIKQAQAEGRDLTEAELDEIVHQDDVAKGELAAAITKARMEGR